MAKTITSIDEFKRIYYPKQYEEDRISNMTPKELGKYLAQKSLDSIKLELEKLLQYPQN